MEHKQAGFKLPISIITLHDISTLISELDAIDNFFIQVKSGSAETKSSLPVLSKALDDILRDNSLKLTYPNDRVSLKLALQTIKTKAPKVHMSFSTTPSRRFLEQLITYLRSDISPFIVLQIGLQPNIGAGFTLRTPSKYFDFSLRSRFEKNRDLLVKMLTKGVSI